MFDYQAVRMGQIDCSFNVHSISDQLSISFQVGKTRH